MKKVEEELTNLKREYNNIHISDKGVEIMQKAIERAKSDKRKAELKRKWRQRGLGIAAALAILVILPNANEKIAYAMQQIPLVGKVFKVITIRDYTYDDGHNKADVKVPKIITDEDDSSENDAVNQVNKSAEEYTNELLAQFENNIQTEGYQGLDVSYKVVTNSDTWFTLDIAAVQTQASGYEFHRYYNINKVIEQQIALKDLFQEGSDYVSAISEDIKQQMKEKMAADEGLVYWLENEDYPEDNFIAIKEDQNFYLNQDENLVIIFDEYEVAPGYMGVQEFTIKKDAIKNILK